MQRDFVVIAAWASVASPNPRRAGAVTAYPVLDETGAPVGLLDLTTVAANPDLVGRRAGEVCIPLARVRLLSPEDGVDPGHLRGGSVPALVLQGGVLVGLVGRAAAAVPARPRRNGA